MMACLLPLLPNDQPVEISDSILVGRSQDADIIIDDFRAETEICYIIFENHECYIDNRAKRGVVLNGMRLKPESPLYLLQDGDEIYFFKSSKIGYTKQKGYTFYYRQIVMSYYEETKESLSSVTYSSSILQNFDKTSSLHMIGEELKCGICLDIIKDPVTTQCMHNFCCNCIMIWRQTSFKCPVCTEISLHCRPNKALNNLIHGFSRIAKIESQEKPVPSTSETPTLSPSLTCSFCKEIKTLRAFNEYSIPSLKFLEDIGGKFRLQNIQKEIIQKQLDINKLQNEIKKWVVDKAVSLLILREKKVISSLLTALCEDCMNEAWLSMLEEYLCQFPN